MGIRVAVLRDELGIITFTLEQMGFDIVAFYEADPKTAEMCRRNLNCGCIQRDLLQCQETDLPQMELLIAQLPHQVFGESGQRLGSGMGWELRKYLEIIHRKRPQVFLFKRKNGHADLVEVYCGRY